MDVFDILFGGAEGGGVAELLARVAAFAVRNGAADAAWDYYIWKDALGGPNGQKNGWQSFSEEFGGDNKLLQKAVKGHGLLRQRLEAHKHETGVEPLLKEYAASGEALPSADVVHKVGRKLAMFYHPDRTGGDKAKEALFKSVREAAEDLQKPEIRAAYEEALRDNPEAIRKYYKEISGKDWDKIYESFSERLLLENGTKAAGNNHFSQARKWISARTDAEKAGLALGAVGSVVLGSYLTAKVVDRKAHNENDGKDWAKDAAMGAANGALSGGILAGATSAAVSLFSRAEGQNVGKLVMHNIKTTHFIPIVAATTLLAVLGAKVRHDRAKRHNGWVDRQSETMEPQNNVAFQSMGR